MQVMAHPGTQLLDVWVKNLSFWGEEGSGAIKPPCFCPDVTDIKAGWAHLESKRLCAEHLLCWAPCQPVTPVPQPVTPVPLLVTPIPQPVTPIPQPVTLVPVTSHSLFQLESTRHFTDSKTTGWGGLEQRDAIMRSGKAGSLDSSPVSNDPQGCVFSPANCAGCAGFPRRGVYSTGFTVCPSVIRRLGMLFCVTRCENPGLVLPGPRDSIPASSMT